LGIASATLSKRPALTGLAKSEIHACRHYRATEPSGQAASGGSRATRALANGDIGFVEAGPKAIVKIESFPFMRYGTVSAAITRVARDAIPEADARQADAAGPLESPDVRGFATDARSGVSGDADARQAGRDG
jgi:hypothetical protein